MRRPVLYLAGLFLATGASLALAAPASAAGTNCKKHSGHAASVHGSGHSASHGGGHWVPDYYGYDDGGIAIDNDLQYQRNTQIGLFNFNTGPFGL